MGPVYPLFIVELIVALIAAAVVVVLILLPIIFPPRVVRPSARIEFLDAHPRHVCRDDTVSVNWRGFGESGLLLAANLGPFSPFYRETLAPSRISMGSSTLAASTGESFEVTLELSRPGTLPVTRGVTISNHSSPNLRIPLTVPLTFTLDPVPGWVGRRVFASDALIDPDDWSPTIHVTGLEYPEALPPSGGTRPTRDRVRDVKVSWEGRELTTLSVDHPDHIHLPEETTVVGEWALFVVANPGDGPTTLLQSVTIRLMPRCVRR